MKNPKTHTPEQIKAMENEKILKGFLLSELSLDSLPEAHGPLIAKISWYCVKNEVDPDLFFDALASPNPEERFKRAGRLMGKKLDYSDAIEKRQEFEESASVAAKYAAIIYDSIAPWGIEGQLKGIYNQIAVQAAWYCIRENETTEAAVRALMECASVEEMSEFASGLKRGEVNFYRPKPLRSDEQQIEIENGFAVKMHDDGVPTNLQPLVFSILTAGRTKYTHLREYSPEIVNAARYLYNLKNPLETWQTMEAMRIHLKSPKEFTCEFMDFANRFAIAYPIFSGDKNGIPPDYFRASGQYYGLNLEEAQKRPYLSTKEAEIARLLARDLLRDTDKVTMEVLELAKMSAREKPNVPTGYLYMELEPFRGLSTKEAYDNFGKIMDKGIRIRSLILMDRLVECCKFDNDPIERMFQRSIIQESAYMLTRENMQISPKYLAEKRKCFPEELARDIEDMIKETKRQSRALEIAPEI